MMLFHFDCVRVDGGQEVVVADFNLLFYEKTPLYVRIRQQLSLVYRLIFSCRFHILRLVPIIKPTAAGLRLKTKP